MHTRISFALIAALTLTGCDQIGQKLGLEDTVKKDARAEAEGKAVGSACRQSGRAIEDCFSIYSWLPKSSVFEGWREMDGYMRDNKIETIVPQLPPPEAPGSKKKKKPAGEETAATGVESSKASTAEEPAKSGTPPEAAKTAEKSAAKH